MLNSYASRIARRRVELAAVFAVIVGLVGCGAGGPKAKNVVSGKVTLNGQAVGGEVVFVGGNKSEAAAPIKQDGTYEIQNPPAGDVQILVKGLSGPSLPPGGKPPGDAPPPPTAGVSPPARYAQLNNGLKFKVTGGQQKHDITLTP